MKGNSTADPTEATKPNVSRLIGKTHLSGNSLAAETGKFSFTAVPLSHKKDSNLLLHKKREEEECSDRLDSLLGDKYLDPIDHNNSGMHTLNIYPQKRISKSHTNISGLA